MIREMDQWSNTPQTWTSYNRLVMAQPLCCIRTALSFAQYGQHGRHQSGPLTNTKPIPSADKIRVNIY